MVNAIIEVVCFVILVTIHREVRIWCSPVSMSVNNDEWLSMLTSLSWKPKGFNMLLDCDSLVEGLCT